MASKFELLIQSCPERVRNATKASAPRFSLSGRTMAVKLFPAYDGDSVVMATELEDRVVSFAVRTLHIDTPEMRTRDPVEKALAIEAKERMRDLTADKVCCVVCQDSDKYGRVLADIFLASGESVADILLREKLAVPYEGKTKKADWNALRRERDAFLAASAK